MSVKEGCNVLFDANFTHLLSSVHPHIVTFEIREEAPGIGQPDSYYAQDDGRAASQVLEDDYGIAVY